MKGTSSVYESLSSPHSGMFDCQKYEMHVQDSSEHDQPNNAFFFGFSFAFC